jgi:hypothetical protein
VYPTFIEPDAVGGVALNDPLRDTALVAWWETLHFLGALRMRQRVQAVSGISSWSEVTDVVASGGSNDAWSPNLTCGPAVDANGNPVFDRSGNPKQECWSGDYQYGAFLQKAGADRLQFFRVWPASNPAVAAPNLEVYANLVNVQVLTP